MVNLHSQTRLLRHTLAVWALVCLSWSAQAHIVYGSDTLQLLIFQSDLVLLARIADPAAPIVFKDPTVRETVVEAEVLASFKGDVDLGAIRFVQHGHGVVRYTQDAEVLLFLKKIEQSRELAGTAVAAVVDWVSQQEITEAYVFDRNSRDDYLAAVRAYTLISARPAEKRAAALNNLTLDLLGSQQPRLAVSALRDLALSGDAYVINAQQLKNLEALVADAEAPIALRIGVLGELERRAIVDAAPRWVSLLSSTQGANRLAVVRAVRVHPSNEVTAKLIDLLHHSDQHVVAAAAISLGVPGNAAAVAPMAKLMTSDESRVRMAAIRGLGRIGSKAAWTVLEQIAGNHSDRATQRRAAAELRILQRLAPS